MSPALRARDIRHLAKERMDRAGFFGGSSGDDRIRRWSLPNAARIRQSALAVGAASNGPSASMAKLRGFRMNFIPVRFQNTLHSAHLVNRLVKLLRCLNHRPYGGDLFDRSSRFRTSTPWTHTGVVL